MKFPWQNRTGYPKAIAILATILTISLGLCGANFFAVIRFVPLGGPASSPGTPTWPGTLLSITGWAEIIAICGSVLGLAIVGGLRSVHTEPATKDEEPD
jgi:hypothetical protein